MASFTDSSRSGPAKRANTTANARAQDEFIDVSFDDVIAVDLDRERSRDRAGEPFRVCLLCGEEDPASHGACAHEQVATFAKAPATVFEASERVRRARVELFKAQRTLLNLVRSAAAVGEVLIDERVKESAVIAAPSEPAPRFAWAEHKAFDAQKHERARAKRKRAMSENGQAVFPFAIESGESAAVRKTNEHEQPASGSLGTDQRTTATETSTLRDERSTHHEHKGKDRRRRKSAA